MECDSFITLGLECDTGGSSTDPDFDGTGFNTSGEVSGGWYNSAPPNGQGAPDANGRVMIARLSYKQNKTASGDVCLFIQASGGDIVAFPLQGFDCGVPGGGLPLGGGLPPADFFVDDDCDGEGSGSEADPFCTIQEGIDETDEPPTSGQIVEVAPGTYAEWIDFQNRKITVRSSGGAAVTPSTPQG